MLREAILIGNPVKSSEKKFNVDQKQLRKKIADITNILENLGEHKFKVKEIVSKKRDQAGIEIKSYIREYKQQLDRQEDPNEKDCLLIYYFGHGVQRKNDLCFVFKDSKTSEFPSLLPFNDVAQLMNEYKIPRIIFIIDCCYAGASTQKVNTTLTSGIQYCILASSIPTQKSKILGGPSPFGTFSLILFEGILDEYAVKEGTQNITPNSLHQYILRSFNDLNITQEPYKYDGGLDSYTITELQRQIIVDPRYNMNSPKRCFYRKLHWIITTIKDEGEILETELYKKVISTQPEDLLTPILNKDGIYINAPVNKNTFNSYLERLRDLNILRSGNPLRLTRDGLGLLARNESSFNTKLFELIEIVFNSYDYSFDNLDRLIRFKAHIRRIPSASNLYVDAKSKDNLFMEPVWFNILLDLLAQAGYLKYSSQRTYFPY